MDTIENEEEISQNVEAEKSNSSQASNKKNVTVHFLVPTDDANIKENVVKNAEQNAENDVVEGIGEVQISFLDDALNEDKVTNIAITGPLGSGKSSLIRTYEKQHNKNFAYISLAEFEFKNKEKDIGDTNNDNTSKAKDNNNLTKTNIVQTLEQKIINQLVAIPEEQIKEKDYKTSGEGQDRKKKVKTTRKTTNTSYPPEKSILNRNQFIAALIGYVFLVVVALIICSNINDIPTAALIIVACILVIPLILMIVWFLKTGSPAFFKKITANTFEIDMNTDSNNGSLFDRNIALLMRIFEARPYIDVYVFEDIERLNCDIIFVHLRELNTILNSYFKGQRVIKFIYCISDDTLERESRAKFFDVLISVIPYTNGYNAYGHLIDLLATNADELDYKLLRNIALYISDDRLLKCIINDYNIYLGLLYSEGNQYFNKNELFALMALKNAAPHLFANLQTRIGEIYKLLETKNVKDDFNESGLREINDYSIEEAIKKDMSESSEQEITYATRLTSYLITNRYIEEDYYFYLALRDGKALSLKDQQWLMGARRSKADYEFPLESPEKVSFYLESYDYRRPSMLNISLLKWLIDENKVENTSNDVSDEDGNEISSPIEAVIDCIVEEAETSKENSFAKITIDEIPEFPAITVPIYPTFFKEVVDYTNIDRRKFTLSVIQKFGNDPDGLKQYDEDNDNLIGQELSTWAGTYGKQNLDPYDINNIDIRSIIISATKALNETIIRLDTAADKTLIQMIALEDLYYLSKDNLQVVSDLFCDPENSKKYELDRVQVSHHELAWDFILENTDDFVNQYFADNENTLSCTESTFKDLINSEMTSESRQRLLQSYTGEIQSILEIENNEYWNDALEFLNIRKTKENLIVTLGAVGASKQWIDYVNSFEELNLKAKDFPSELRENLAEEVLSYNELKDDKYALFIRCADINSLEYIPKGLDAPKVVLLYKANVIKLNQNTIKDARLYLSPNELADYELANLDEYLSYAKRNINSSNRVKDDEIINILKRIQKDDYDRIDDIVGLLSSQVKDIDGIPDDAVLSIIKRKKLSTNTYKDLFSRYGNDSDLDIEILRIVGSIPNLNIAQYAPSAQLLLDINESYTLSIQQKLKIIQAGMHNGSTDLDKVLRALDNSDIEDILDGKHPKYEKLDPEAKQIVNILIAEGYLVDHRDRGIYKKEKKWKSDNS